MAIAGGVLLSTVVTLYFVPPVFLLVATTPLPQGLTAGWGETLSGAVRRGISQLKPS